MCQRVKTPQGNGSAGIPPLLTNGYNTILKNIQCMEDMTFNLRLQKEKCDSLTKRGFAFDVSRLMKIMLILLWPVMLLLTLLLCSGLCATQEHGK